METNVDYSKVTPKIPAGIFNGTEIFAANGTIYAMYHGNRLLFEELPSLEKRSFIADYIADKEAQKFIRDTFGITGFESGFKQWLFCKFGSLDGEPDSIDGRITPDKFNSACTRTDCPGRGKVCGKVSGLKGYEVATLQQVVAGRNTKEAADNLHVSVPGMKSRIIKLKSRFAAANIVVLAAKAVDMGITGLENYT